MSGRYGNGSWKWLAVLALGALVLGVLFVRDLDEAGKKSQQPCCVPLPTPARDHPHPLLPAPFAAPVAGRGAARLAVIHLLSCDTCKSGLPHDRVTS